MDSNIFNRILLIIGFVSLGHAAYSAAHYRTYLRLTEQEFIKLPIDIALQLLISLVIIIYNLIQLVGIFKEIRATVDMQAKSWDTLGNLPSFYTFNHRGKALSVHYIPEKTAGSKSTLDIIN